MRRSVCVEFFKKYLKEVSEGRGYREHGNPAVDFTKRAKAGEYDRLSDQMYNCLLADTEDIARFWLDEAKKTASDLLRIALEDIRIDEKTINRIAEMLAECYEASVKKFTSPEDFETLDDSEEPCMTDEELESLQNGKAPWEEEEEKSVCGQESAGSSKARTEQTDFPGSKQERRTFPGKGVLLGQKSDRENAVSPGQIYQYLEKHIYGQKEALRAAAMLLYNHMQGRKRNLLFVGPTGCGKTEIWRVCQQLYPQIRIIDSTRITGEGWIGSFKVKNIFDHMSRIEAERAIIVFDEFDKLCEPQISAGGSNHSLIAQNELLKIIEGAKVPGPDKCEIDSSKISFVFCGSFEQLTSIKNEKESDQSIGFGAKPGKRDARHIYEGRIRPSDLVRYSGMRQEIAGRISQVVQLAPMKAEDYRKILRDSQISPLIQLENLYNVKLWMDEATEERLAREAEETGLGVRYLKSRIQDMLDRQMFWDCGRPEYRLWEPEEGSGPAFCGKLSA